MGLCSHQQTGVVFQETMIPQLFSTLSLVVVKETLALLMHLMALHHMISALAFC